MGKKLTIEFIRQRAKELSGCELLSTEYEGNQQRLRFRCACGNEFEKTWNEFQDRGRCRCTACAKEQQYNEKRLTAEQVSARLSELGYEWISGDYENQKSRLTVRCRCGHERTGRFTNIVDQNPSGLCAACARRESHSFDIHWVWTLSSLRYGVECLETRYVDAKTPMRFRCSCGAEFTTNWNNLVSSGQRLCPDCSGKISRGERAVQLWLEQHGIGYVREKRFADCGGKKPYPFDFFLPDRKVCIEFDGEQHFRKEAFHWTEERFAERKAHDAAKDAYCAAKGLDLIRISYREFNHIDEILTAKLIPR